jgi:hypothetical protein
MRGRQRKKSKLFYYSQWELDPYCQSRQDATFCQYIGAAIIPVVPAFLSFQLFGLSGIPVILAFGHSGFSPVIPVNAIKRILNSESGMSGKKPLCTRDNRRVRLAPCSTFDNHGKQRRSDTPLLKFQMRRSFTAHLPLDKRC